MSHCDILKISDNELLWLTGKTEFDEAIGVLRKKYATISLLFLTLGKSGSKAYSQSGYAFVPAIPAKTIEATGAGDTFFGAILGKILEKGMKDYSDRELAEMLRYANAAAGIITERKGALKVMPSVSEIELRLSANSAE